jgi:cation transport regulator ChaB
MNQYAVSEKNRISAENARNEIGVAEANAQREAAINQFNTQLEDQRQRFNVENQRLIDQSNVTWRRSINTANTAAINAANQTDAQNLLNISNFALSALWQQWRDEASWINTASENTKERAHNIAIAAIERESQIEYLSEQAKYGMSQMLGELGLKIFGNMKLPGGK